MNRKKVLYAEDDFVNQELLRVKLNKVKIQCDIVSDGKTAVLKCRNNKYDLIILDHYMPVLDGMQAAKQIRKLLPKKPIVALTSDDNIKEKLLRNGFNDVIIKPLRGDKIKRLIELYLS